MVALADGMHRLDPGSGQLLVRTSRTGLGARAGHDLTIEATRWEGIAVVDEANPANSSVAVDIDANSFEVISGTGGVKPLTASDRATIKTAIREQVLDLARHPEISFRSTRVSGTPDGFVIEGDLTIVGVTRPAIVRCTVTADGRVHGAAIVKQTEWGIKPYSAFFGALRLRDEVEVEVDIGLPTIG
jgi:polyisoprenoid-binding protein YceI